MIEQGAIGSIEMFRGLTCDGIPPVDYLRTSGGLFKDVAVHDIDAGHSRWHAAATMIARLKAAGIDVLLLDPQFAPKVIAKSADKEMVMPGDTLTFVVKLLAPIAMEQGLNFAIREGGRTVGAGVVTKIVK